MNKIFLFLKVTCCMVCCFFFIENSSGQILHSESFDATTFLPTGWTALGTAPDWARITALSTPLVGGPHSGAGMARMRYPTTGSAASVTESVCTPSFALSGRGTNTPTVSLWIYRDSLVAANKDSMELYINTTNSLTGATKLGVIARNRSTNVPDTTLHNGWFQYTFNIPPSFATNTNYIIFKGTVYGPSASARRLVIDDVNWTEYTPFCTGTLTAGTISSPDTLICNAKGIW